jgi:hypothetical protein
VDIPIIAPIGGRNIIQLPSSSVFRCYIAHALSVYVQFYYSKRESVGVAVTATPNGEARRMTDDLARLVMKAAATELLYEEAAHIDREVQWLLVEMERAPASECRGTLLQRFLDLLQGRSEVAKKALIMRENTESGAAFAARIWPFSSEGQSEALSSHGRVVAPMNKRHECDAGNRTISRRRRSAGGSTGLTRDGCEVPEGSTERAAHAAKSALGMQRAG